MANRPALPKRIERAVKMEAGHRCAIPACGQHPVEVAHIVPRNGDPSKDVFENLIALCPTCHTRYDRGDIDRPAMRQYKANLSVLNYRYGDLERRLLENFAELRGTGLEGGNIVLPGGMKILLRYLLQDGLIAEVKPSPGAQPLVLGMPTHEYFRLTDEGGEFIDLWLHAGDLEKT